MNDIPIGEMMQNLAPNAGLILAIIVFGYKMVKDTQKERKLEAEKQAKVRKEETDRLINAHTKNYEKLQTTLNDYIGEFAEMRKDLEVVKQEQERAGKERTDMLKVLQEHHMNFDKIELKFENIKLKISQ